MTSSLVFSQLTNELIRACEIEILETTNNEFEMVIALSEDGDVILKKTGAATYVNFTDEEFSMIYGCAVLIHNHPSSGGLSIIDIKTAILYNIREVRALAPKSIYGYGTWVVTNNQSDEPAMCRLASFIFSSEMYFDCIIEADNYATKILPSLEYPNFAKYLMGEVMDMRSVQFSTAYKLGVISFHFETVDFVHIEFDVLLKALGCSMNL